MHIDNNNINYTEKITFYYINLIDFLSKYLKCKIYYHHQRQFEIIICYNTYIYVRIISNQLQMMIDISKNI